MTRFTPGPWKTAERAKGSNQGIVIRSVNHDDGGSIAISLGYQSEECLANARLIAASPDLLDALISIKEYWSRDRNDQAMHDACWHAVETAAAAIAKVRGETQQAA